MNRSLAMPSPAIRRHLSPEAFPGLLFPALVVALLVLPRTAAAAPPIIVGDGTATSCTQVALEGALITAEMGGGTIRFNCGDTPVTIPLIADQQDPDWGPVALIPPDHTTIYGGGLITFELVDGTGTLVRSGHIVALKNLSLVTGPITYTTFVINLGALTLSQVTVSHNYFPVLRNFGAFAIKNCTFSNNGIGSPVDATLQNYGTGTIDHSSFLHHAGDVGGVIENFGGTLDVNNSIFSDNHSDFAGAIYNSGRLRVNTSQFSRNAGAAGGAITNWDGGISTIANSTFSSNFATAFGGAIAGGASVDHCQFFDNFSGASGGAIAGGGVVTNSTFLRNHANSSGGAISAPGTLSVRNSTFSGNEADDGGAISADTLTVIGSTITGNTAHFEGGGIYVLNPPTLIRTTVTSNVPDDVFVVVQP